MAQKGGPVLDHLGLESQNPLNYITSQGVAVPLDRWKFRRREVKKLSGIRQPGTELGLKHRKLGFIAHLFFPLHHTALEMAFQFPGFPSPPLGDPSPAQ